MTSTLTALLLLAGCDEGRIYEREAVVEETGATARFVGTVRGIGTWSDGYQPAIAGFEDGNDYALISKSIVNVTDEGVCDVTLSGIPAAATRIELCVLDRLRKRVATILTADIEGASTRLTADSVDISMGAAVQNEIFNTTCVQCHGSAGYAAAGLDLRQGKSLPSLIGIPSVKNPDMMRVEPGRSDSSMLFLALDTDISSSWRYDHSVEVVRQEKLDLIRNWIEHINDE